MSFMRLYSVFQTDASHNRLLTRLKCTVKYWKVKDIIWQDNFYKLWKMPVLWLYRLDVSKDG